MIQQERRNRVVVAGESVLFLDELHPHPFRREPAHDGAKIIEVTGKAVHRVNEHSVNAEVTC